MSRSKIFSLGSMHSAILIQFGICLFACLSLSAQQVDPIAQLQKDAAHSNQSAWGYWGPDSTKYSSWTNHTNRLVPVYSYGIDLKAFKNEKSKYRNQKAIENIYGFLPENTVNPKANYFDQTDIFQLQELALRSGKKRIILFVFDGMDWDTSQIAAIAKTGRLAYQSGRGQGLSFLDYRGTQTDFGYCVTSPHNSGTKTDVDKQLVTSVADIVSGGYDAKLGGETPWQRNSDLEYPIAKSKVSRHAFTDSAASATSLTCGIKTYNGAINVDHLGREVLPLARKLQEEGFGIGVVTSVPISHATPACAYANNVHRNDYQDLTRDLLGRPSIFHPGGLQGVDVLIGCGWGVEKQKDSGQGANFVAGNKYITAEDLKAINIDHGGKYVVAQRTSGASGKSVLSAGVRKAKQTKARFFGYFGTGEGHLPYQTADGKFNPVESAKAEGPVKAEAYSPADLSENVQLDEMAIAALDVLESRSDQWWLMVEAGDVDWANHANNIDDSIGAVISGAETFKAITKWIEANGGWESTALILTADHGHYLNLVSPEKFVETINARVSKGP